MPINVACGILRVSRDCKLFYMSVNTTYSKMVANKLFFCLHVKWPSLPHFHFKILFFLNTLTRQRGLINMQTKELFIRRHFGIRPIAFSFAPTATQITSNTMLSCLAYQELLLWVDRKIWPDY